VGEIYWRKHWQAGRCERMPWPVNLAHFDACVNTGLRQAAKFLQRAVDAEDDGRIGPLTLRAMVERDRSQRVFLKGLASNIEQSL
jgi:lysozyme family protein